jgi:superfamily II DNA/RNA helicase
MLDIITNILYMTDKMNSFENEDEWDTFIELDIKKEQKITENNIDEHVNDDDNTTDKKLNSIDEKLNSTDEKLNSTDEKLNSTDEIIYEDSFDKMNLKDNLLRGIYEYGIEKPAICQRIIPSIIKDSRDNIISASAGSGKTLIFTIAALNFVYNTINETQVLILSPTRELALQTYNYICKIGKHCNISIALHRGIHNNNKTRNEPSSIYIQGSKKSESYMSFGKCIEGKEHIIVATLGRYLDLITNKHEIKLSDTKRISKLSTKYIGMLILDEADEILSPAKNLHTTALDIFEHIETIECCKKIIISATIDSNMCSLCETFLTNPLQILVEKEDIKSTSINEYYVQLNQEEHKIDCLLDIYRNVSIITSIIFTNTTEKAKYINNEMTKNGFSVGCIYGSIPQTERDNIMDKFKNGSIRILIATDLIGRGIDVQTVSCVFNYDLPTTVQNYIHRIGRSGRFGRIGSAISLVTDISRNKPRDILELERHYGHIINELPKLQFIKSL